MNLQQYVHLYKVTSVMALSEMVGMDGDPNNRQFDASIEIGIKAVIDACGLDLRSHAATVGTNREAFEQWVQTTAGWKACKQRGKPMHLRQNADGSYNDFRVNDRWFAWQAATRYRDEQEKQA